MKLVMYAHGGSKNHGCEAIVRTTARLLTEIDSRSILLSYKKEEDEAYGLHQFVEIRQELHEINKKSPDFMLAYLRQKLFHDYHRMDALMHKKAINELPAIDVALFIGGDNYCYSDVKNYAPINDYMQKKAKKLVLWGTSVEPELLEDKAIREDIKRFDLIVARESISFESLKKVNGNTILLPDPAFHLQCEKVELPEGFVEENTIGINLSPLIIEHEKEKGCVLANYENLMEYIIKETDCQIALIPHVVWESNDDRTPLRQLYEKYKETGRVVLVEDHNCMAQKYIISKCRMFVGARTHATIAAYSTCVPTLVVGYSVKARGIARDLFGTEEKYVIPAQSLSNTGQLQEAFRWIRMHEQDIRSQLMQRQAEYKEYQNAYAEDLRR